MHHRDLREVREWHRQGRVRAMKTQLLAELKRASADGATPNPESGKRSRSSTPRGKPASSSGPSVM
eukprot:8019553-Pyramimonas_sp.AAC.1